MAVGLVAAAGSPFSLLQMRKGAFRAQCRVGLTHQVSHVLPMLCRGTSHLARRSAFAPSRARTGKCI